MTTDEEQLLREMWCAYTLHATPMPFSVREAMAAVLAVVRAHDRDGERWRERAEQLACMNDGETAERYWAKVDVLVERNRGSIPERAAADAAMRGEG